ncbi:transcription elongation factor NusA [Petrotoga sp. 9PW.55.5.1]|uniref:transcription termination factor NusA n=1 Tax=Petrotoga sp. 9PW.55.5.1 TaxID=1308979 RepID=UPI000DC227A5|nr:transcription termination factor NusA [Petrotoga sp. 9PW.55.5.1]RAO99596.1 transcription elongation factor NusA [Petrotoga sp. 9PW.55.5.1]
MNLNLLEALDALEKDKGISRDSLVDIIAKSIKSAYKKNYGTKNVEIEIDKNLTKLNVYQIWRVVDEVENPKEEISLEDAQKIEPKIKIGDTIKKKINLKKDFRRVAAQTAKQVILQNLKELEKKNLYEKYSALKNKVSTAEVVQLSEDHIDIRIGKLETKLPIKETIPGENFKTGELIKVYIKNIQQTSKGPKIMVSRTAPEFVKELLYSIVPEIEEGIIKIVKISREPGIRTKVAVVSSMSAVDPVGACIGEKGSRISELIKELKNEKVDIIEYSEDPKIFIKNALAPTEVKNIILNEQERTAFVYVPEDQLSLAVGKGGQSARLAAKITGWKIDIHSLTH